MLWLIIGNRTSPRPIWSVIIILVIKQIGLPLSSRLILLITSRITDRIGLHTVLLPLQTHRSLGKLSTEINLLISIKLFILESRHLTGFFNGSQMLYQNVEYRGNDPRTRCTCWMRKELRKPLPAKLTFVLTRKSNARLGRPQFGSNSPLHGVKLQSNARAMRGGEMDGFGIDWYISNTPQSLFPIPLYVQARYFYDVCFSVKVHLSLS